MAFWLAKQRNGQETDFIQRFDPRFWTVNFPRPMMASVVTSAPDALRIDCDFYNRGDLAGLIWDSEDRIDHPLLAYRMDRDYSRTELSFQWDSAGIIPLDQADGPTLTIEGRDAGGTQRSWYVRLWNYADGTPESARITLPFSNLTAGFEPGGEQVHVTDIDRMFISLPPIGYSAGSSDRFPQRRSGRVLITEIRCAGERSMLEIGDVMLPPHGSFMATGYDDAYNQTPARLIRSIRALGYRDTVLHYVGMSHFYRLVDVNGQLQAARTGVVCNPANRWHRAFFSELAERGYEAIVSLSFELLAQNCPPEWRQLAEDGTPAETGWVPPSNLLSPANSEALGWLRLVAAAFTRFMTQENLPVRFQIGEPWWWVLPDGRPCIYDAAALEKFGAAAVSIPTLKAPLSPAQTAMMDQAGEALSEATQGLAQYVKAVHGGNAEILLLAFTPTILDPEMPEMKRANLPLGWAYPAFDRLQLEDYDWLTAGADARRRAAYAEVDDRLGYPPADQDYLSGFVLGDADAEAFWPLIDDALDEAAKRGIPRTFVWALPQISRDGYVRLAPAQEDEVQAFDDVYYPLPLGRDTAVSPEFSTTIAVTASGFERRNSLWSDARLSFDVGPGIRAEQEMTTLLQFFRARRGPARAFRLTDPYDHSSAGMSGLPTADDQLIGTGDGLRSTFQLIKNYGGGGEPQVRSITRPQATSVTVSIDGIATTNWTLSDKGEIAFAEAPEPGAQIMAGFLFDVPVRFVEDRLNISAAGFAAGEAPSVPLIEVREA